MVYHIVNFTPRIQAHLTVIWMAKRQTFQATISPWLHFK